MILVCNTGSAMDLSAESEKCNAVIQSWYSGQAGGQAVADIIFGDAVPGGKLPVTFYKDETQPPMDDYSMKGRTYRYFDGDVVYPYGLSYSTFEYYDLSITENGAIITVKNTGNVKADEIAELYIDKMPAEKLENGLNTDISDLDKLLDPSNQPKYSLAGFERVTLEPGEFKVVQFDFNSRLFSTVLENGKRVNLKGKYKIYVGGQQPDTRSKELTGNDCLEGEIIL